MCRPRSAALSLFRCWCKCEPCSSSKRSRQPVGGPAQCVVLTRARPQRAGYFHGAAYYVAVFLVSLPFVLLELFIFTIIVYAMAGLRNQARAQSARVVVPWLRAEACRRGPLRRLARKSTGCFISSLSRRRSFRAPTRAWCSRYRPTVRACASSRSPHHYHSVCACRCTRLTARTGRPSGHGDRARDPRHVQPLLRIPQPARQHTHRLVRPARRG
jgi:hypothetical protein